jgi:hypothetical protein
MSVDLMLNTQRFWFRQDARARRRRRERALHYGPLEVAFPGADGFDATEEDIQRCFDQEWGGHLKWADDILAAGGRSVPGLRHVPPVSQSLGVLLLLILDRFSDRQLTIYTAAEFSQSFSDGLAIRKYTWTCTLAPGSLTTLSETLCAIQRKTSSSFAGLHEEAQESKMAKAGR